MSDTSGMISRDQIYAEPAPHTWVCLGATHRSHARGAKFKFELQAPNADLVEDQRRPASNRSTWENIASFDFGINLLYHCYKST